MTKRDLGILEFIDYNQYTNMESSMVSLRCGEFLLLLYSGKSLSNKQLHDVLRRCNVLLTKKINKSNFNSRDVIQVLNFLLKVPIESLRDSVSSSEYTARAVGALLSYKNLLANDHNYGIITIQ